MSAGSYLRGGLLVFLAGASLILGAGGVFADSVRTRWVFAPRERGVEAAIGQVVEREKALHASTGRFVAFSNADIERDGALLGLPWAGFPVRGFFFDATELDTGNLRLRALPRPEAVVALTVRARLYVAELSPDGAVARSGWFPSN